MVAAPALFALWLLASENAPSGPLPLDPRTVEVRFVDESVLKLLLADEAIEVETPHGRLRVPTEDIRRIVFAQRLPEAARARVDELLGLLANPDEQVHLPAARELIALREIAYLPVLNAAKSGDPNVAPRAADVLVKLRAKLGKEASAIRSDDLIETVDARIAGQIVMPSLKVRTAQFGELDLRVADARSLRLAAVAAPEPMEVESADVLPDPGNLKAYESRLQEVFTFRVTGAVGGGSVWGTDVYTTDSHLGTAAVHAGVVQAGETGEVRVKILPSPPSFAGSERNGVLTRPYGPYGGAYEILKDEPLDE